MQITQLLDEMSEYVIGQEKLNRSMVIGLLVGGHLLIEGLPGLAKTLAVKTLASLLHGKFQRVQFTPDLLPSDLIGTLIYNERTSEFTAKKGPIFTNILLADEINRSPAKVQSALLEAMAEKQVTIGDTSFELDKLFLVMATQNPIEQEGTYNLPEAQLDRFLFKIIVKYPDRIHEMEILEKLAKGPRAPEKSLFEPTEILKMQGQVQEIFVDAKIREYILRLILCTRPDEKLTEQEAHLESLAKIRRYILIGASPRATLFLQRAAQANAFLENRDFVTPDDIKSIARDVLRHRIYLNFEAESDGISVENLLNQLLETAVIP